MLLTPGEEGKEEEDYEQYLAERRNPALRNSITELPGESNEDQLPARAFSKGTTKRMDS